MIGILAITISVIVSILSITIGDSISPIIGLVISLIGFFFERKHVVDLGILISSGAFFYVLRYPPLNYLNLFLIIGTFFLYFVLWMFIRWNILITKLEKNVIGSEDINILKDYKMHSCLYNLSTILFAFFITLTGGMIATYSFVGPLSSTFETYLTIVFSVGTLTIIYLILSVLPKHLTK